MCPSIPGKIGRRNASVLRAGSCLWRLLGSGGTWRSILRVERFVAREDRPDFVDDGGRRVPLGSSDLDKQRVGPHIGPVLWVDQGHKGKVPSSATHLTDIIQPHEAYRTKRGLDFVVGDEVTGRLDVEAAKTDPPVEEERISRVSSSGDGSHFSCVYIVVCCKAVAPVVVLRP